MVRFFNKEQEEQLVAAIRAAEANTSGEIRIHLEKNYQGEDVVAEAWKTFFGLGMHHTQERNGVLIFLAPEQKTFAIIGDEGINKVTPPDFWQQERDLLQEHFRRSAFVEGLCKALSQVGEKLKVHFPHQDDDANELSDEISYGD